MLAQCVFCKAEVHLEDYVDVAACFTCLDDRALPRSGEGLIEYLCSDEEGV